MAEPVIDPTRDREAFLAQPWVSDPVIKAYKRHIDRTLVRANLRLMPEQRLPTAMALQRFAEELRRAGARLDARPAAPGDAPSRTPDFVATVPPCPAGEGG